MDLFCFASATLTNVWAGIGAGLWAVAETSPTDMKARITKSKRMQVGAAGLLFCNETHAFTTPFLVYSQPDPERVVTDVWAAPHRQISSESAKANWPLLKGVGAGGVSAALNITGTTVFVPKEVTANDWTLILESLAEV